MRYLGIDYGDKKIGLAFGESEARVAVPLEVMINKGPEKVVADIKIYLEKEMIEKIVVGVPLSNGGHHGPEQLDKTRAFIACLKEAVSVPVDEEDESFTTCESIRLQREEGTRVEDDALAAMIILQSYFDRTP